MRARTATASRKALLRALASAGVATFIVDRDGFVEWWSEDCAELLDRPAGEMVGQWAGDLVRATPDQLPTREKLRHDRRWRGSAPFLRSDGSVLHAQAFLVMLCDGNGAHEGWLGGIHRVVGDLTDGTNAGSLSETFVSKADTAIYFCDGGLDDPGPTIVYANEAACEFSQVSFEDIVGTPIGAHIEGRVSPEVFEAMRARVRRGEQVEQAVTIVRTSGEEITAEITVTPFRAHASDSPHLMIFVRDVTKQRAAQEEAAAEENRLRLAAHLAGIGAWELHVDTGVVVCDDRVREMIGVAPGAPTTIETWFDALTPVDRTLARRRLEEMTGVVETPDEREVAYRLAQPDGRECHLLARGRVVERDSDGHPLRVVGVLIDVTDVDQASERVVSTLEAMSEAYFALDRDGRFTYVNPAGEELLGVRREVLVGRSIVTEFPELVGTLVSEQYAEAMNGGSVTFDVYHPPHDRWYEVRAYGVPDGIAVHYRDISARMAEQAALDALLAAEQKARAELSHAATHDPLTGLPNRVELISWLSDQLEMPRRGTHVAVLFFDLDRFKVVNDSLGHAAGDELLVKVARRLTYALRPGDFVARLGGDEFVVAMPNASASEAEAVAERLLTAFREPVVVAGHRLVVTASVGIALDDPTATADTLLRDADAALYLAKDAGRDQVARFDDEVRSGVVERLQTEHELRDAVASGQLTVHYQPSFDLRTGQPIGVEALVRWDHPHRGLLAAGSFIDVAEDTGLIGPIGEWVLPAACEARTHWCSLADLVVWVNVSVRQLVRPGFARGFLTRLAESGASAELVGVEVTESALDDGHSVPVRELRLLHDAGVRIAIDDFGTGYSSLARLRRFPVDVLKLDRAFVTDLGSERGKAVVAAVVELAHAVDALALAEGIETPEQLQAITELGCDAASGFHLVRPVPAHELPAAIAASPFAGAVARV